ncbi:MAG: energy transducer TonB [Bryobacterales bacterium]
MGPGARGAGGNGYGIGQGGRSPVPRKLHGIILISNDASTIPEAADVLTGNPIYTVYLQVPGFEKKWVLQVCVPAGETSETVEPGVIRVLSRKTLDPPYAEHKAPLALSLDGMDPRYLPPRIVVYATVSPEGELGNMRIVSGLNEQTDNQIMANLQEWEFNPAFRDGEPVAVEALFGIPLR